MITKLIKKLSKKLSWGLLIFALSMAVGVGYSLAAMTPPVTLNITSAPPNVIPGCNGTTGFSTVNGQSCATNTGPIMVYLPETSASLGVYNFGTVTLKNGSSGAAVMELQRFLNKFLNLSLVVDGKLGPKTIVVIKQWQMSKGLVPDGLIGAKTKAMMNAEASAGSN